MNPLQKVKEWAKANIANNPTCDVKDPVKWWAVISCNNLMRELVELIDALERDGGERDEKSI